MGFRKQNGDFRENSFYQFWINFNNLWGTLSLNKTQ
jgi:hypothetical protein